MRDSVTHYIISLLLIILIAAYCAGKRKKGFHREWVCRLINVLH